MAATRPASESWEVLSLPSEIQLSTGTLSIVGKNRKGSGDQKGESSSEQQTKIKVNCLPRIKKLLTYHIYLRNEITSRLDLCDET